MRIKLIKKLLMVWLTGLANPNLFLRTLLLRMNFSPNFNKKKMKKCQNFKNFKMKN